MPKKRSPILQKVSNLLKISIFLAKLEKHIASNLIFLKKTRKFKKLKQYNHGYILEYEFSPSNTPLIHYNYRKQLKKRNSRDLYSMFFKCRCLGNFEGDRDHCPLPLVPLPAIDQDSAALREVSQPFDSGDEEESVDQRADRFIEKFYEEIRMQRLESALQLK